MSFWLPILTDLPMRRYLISEVKNNKNECECRVITIHSVLELQAGEKKMYQLLQYDPMVLPHLLKKWIKIYQQPFKDVKAEGGRWFKEREFESQKPPLILIISKRCLRKKDSWFLPISSRKMTMTSFGINVLEKLKKIGEKIAICFTAFSFASKMRREILICWPKTSNLSSLYFSRGSASYIKTWLVNTTFFSLDDGGSVLRTGKKYAMN